MYESYRGGIAEQRLESYPAGGVVTENLLYLSMWVAAGWLLAPIRWAAWPVATIAWALLVVVVQMLLKKHNCSGCYYYGKNCHLGWGKLSAWMCAQDSGDPKTGMRLSLFYIVSPPAILVAAIVVGLTLPVSVTHWVVLGVYVALNVASFPIRKKGCSGCAMRYVCPGSAARSRPPACMDGPGESR